MAEICPCSVTSVCLDVGFKAFVSQIWQNWCCLCDPEAQLVWVVHLVFPYVNSVKNGAGFKQKHKVLLKAELQ